MVDEQSKEKFLEQEQTALEEIKAIFLELQNDSVEIDQDKTDRFCNECQSYLKRYEDSVPNDLPVPYHNIFYKNGESVKAIYNNFKANVENNTRGYINHPRYKDSLRENTKNFANGILHSPNPFKTINFMIDFFKRLNFPRTTTTILGANGVGKSTLLAKINEVFKSYSYTNISLIPAQKPLSLLHPSDMKSRYYNDNNLEHYKDDNKKLADKNYHYTHVSLSLAIIASISEYIKEAIKSRKYPNQKFQVTILEEVIDMWNSFMKNRKLEFNEDDNSLELQPTDDKTLPAYDLVEASDGEKVLLYYILDILLNIEATYI